MLVDINYVLDMAEKGGYAVPALNVYNLETVMGVIAAAEEAKSPLILQCYSRLFTNEEGYYAAPIIIAAAKKASVPVAFHLDHGAGRKEVQRALRSGATGIMIDGSTLPFDENVALTKSVVDDCAAIGVPVEGELGHIGVAKDGVSTEYTRVDEAVDFVNKTGVSCLAIMVGTAHGKYAQAPVLAIDRIAEIHAATKAHLVLHGGSGVPEEQIKAAIKAGIVKINFSTDLCLTFINKVFETSRDKIAIDMFMKEAVEAVKQFALGCMKLLGSEGKA